MNFSFVEQRGRVPFPSFTGERIYMREFSRAQGLPENLARWQSTIDAMLLGVDVDSNTPIFLMIDQAAVKAGESHRRTGVHVDGYWHPNACDHGHSPAPRCANQGGYEAEGLIIASNMLGCAAYVGQWSGKAGSGGDCSAIDTKGMARVDLTPGLAWAGHTRTMLHESLPIAHDCLRTVVRLNVPSWTPKY